MDRTNWKFGEFKINIQHSPPYVWAHLPYKADCSLILVFSLKRGKLQLKNARDYGTFIRLFGAECIDCLVADREFNRKEWTGGSKQAVRNTGITLNMRQNFWIVKPFHR